MMNNHQQDDGDATPTASNQSNNSRSKERGRSRRTRNSINSIPQRRLARGKRRNGSHANDEEPFTLTFFKVGITLMLVSTASYGLFVQRFLRAPTDSSFREHHRVIVQVQHKKAKVEATAMKELSAFDAELASRDVFGIAENYQLNQFFNETSTTERKLDPSLQQSAKLAASLRSTFASLVGGELSARAILQRSLRYFQPLKEQNILPFGEALAQRLKVILDSDKRFLSMVVMGSSAAAGSGNFHNQSYSFMIQQMMDPIMDSMGINFLVQSIAMEHTTELPMTWCLDHYLGDNDRIPDIVVWDYGVSSKLASMEGLIRNVFARANHINEERYPLFIFRDSKTANNKFPKRERLIQSYVDNNILIDPLIVQIDQAVSPFLSMPEKNLPEGFQSWTTSFGGPPGSPGKEHTHLTVQQHTMVAWLISMHLLQSLELLVAELGVRAVNTLASTNRKPEFFLPPPVVVKRTSRERWLLDEDEEFVERTIPAWLPFLVGEPLEREESFLSGDQLAESNHFVHFSGLQCRTTYRTTHASDNFHEVVVAGPVTGPLSLERRESGQNALLNNLIMPKGKMFYSEGWVQDLGKDSKRKKQLSRQWGFLGFQNMINKAFYGLPSSGILSLFLPLSKSLAVKARKELSETGQIIARDYVDAIVICGNDIAEGAPAADALSGVCQLHKDAYVHVGGEMSLLEIIPSGISSCVFINVPHNAKLGTKMSIMNKVAEDARRQKRKGGMLIEREHQVIDRKGHAIVGLPVEVKIRSDSSGALREPCSVAHIIWREVIEESK